MKPSVDARVAVIVPNWNGEDLLAGCLDSVLAQSVKAHLIVVDNGSTDESLEVLAKYPQIELIKHDVNKGYAGGVNPGLQRAIELGLDYAAPFNDDAIADKDWLKHLIAELDERPQVGIVAPKILSADGKTIDSTGDYYTVWGLPYPRGRGESDIDKYDQERDVFAASGGASMYRVKMLEEVGLFDEDFFAYYEDVDLSFRAQLAGWKVRYVPKAVVYHQISATSSKIKGFATYQTLKNLPYLLYKNVPRKYIWKVGRRYFLAHFLFYFRAISRGQAKAAISGDLKGSRLLLNGYGVRRRIQKSRKVSDEYIWSMLVHDLPPNARALRNLRSRWWKLRRKSTN